MHSTPLQHEQHELCDDPAAAQRYARVGHPLEFVEGLDYLSSATVVAEDITVNSRPGSVMRFTVVK